MIKYLLAIILLVSISASSFAGVEYLEDPVYKKLGEGDHHPMDEMLDLAEEGDVRAQFIMGDLYSKNKGGVAKDLTKARKWFEESAIHGYHHSFIRLAVIETRAKNYIEAWKWYTLSIRLLSYGETRDFIIKKRHDIIRKFKLSHNDIKLAEKSISEWENKRDKKLYIEKQVKYKQLQELKKAMKKKKLLKAKGFVTTIKNKKAVKSKGAND